MFNFTVQYQQYFVLLCFMIINGCLIRYYFLCYSINYFICNIIVINCTKGEREISKGVEGGVFGEVEGPKDARSLVALPWVDMVVI